jgi:hypothetical protein
MAQLTQEEQDILAEAERRGIQTTPQVNPEEQAILDEAQRRGISLDKPQPKGKIVAMDMPPKERATNLKTVSEGMGGTAGSIIGGAFGGVPGAAAGAAVGGGAGNVYGQMLEQGAYPPTMVGGVMVPGRGESVDIKPMEAVKEAGVQGVMDLAGGVATKPLSKVAGWATGKLKPRAKELQEAFRKYGGELTHADLTKSSGGDVAQNIAEKSFLGGETMRKFHEIKQAIPLQKGLTKVADDISTGKLTMDEAADLVADGLLGKKKLKMQAMSKNWKVMDEFIGQPGVDINKKVLPLLEDIVSKAPSGGSTSSSRAAKMLEYFKKEYPDGMIPWERAHIEQSDLFDVTPMGAQMQSSIDKANLNRIRTAIRGAMGKSAKNVSDEAFELWQTIQKQYATEMKPYNIKWIKQVMNTEGGANIGRKIFNQKSPRLINELKKITPPERWKDLQSTWLEEEAASLVNKEGLFDLRGFLNKIDNMKGSYDAIFDGPQKKALDDLIDVARLIGEEGGAGKSGAIFVQMKQASAASNITGNLGQGLALGGAAGLGTGLAGGVSAAGFWLGGPWAIAKIITNPTATRFLTRSIKQGGNADYFLKAINVISKAGARETGSLLADEKQTPQPPMNIP